MTRSGTATHKADYNSLLHAIVFAIAMLSISLHGPIARAAIVVTFNDHQIVTEPELERPGQILTTSNKRPPRRLRFRHVNRTQSECGNKQEQHYEHHVLWN